tara:strand:+ start:3527 stop:4279 length:753 start_codon:yes stop_codon:yes gene_type:complete
MKKYCYLFLTLFCLNFITLYGQNLTTNNTYIKDTLKPKSFLKELIVPTSLIGLGVVISNSHFEKEFQKELRNRVGNNYNLPIDNFLRYVPIAEMYLADIAGVKAKNHWFDQTKNLTISIIISDFITYKLKKGIDKRRPNGDDKLESFPSGHTSFAFTNASVLYEEFKDTQPIIAYSGYAFATTTGAFRMVNNAHWMSDVLVAAGIGILVTKLVYHFEPFKKFNPFKKYKNITFIPQFKEKSYGFYFAYQL